MRMNGVNINRIYSQKLIRSHDTSLCIQYIESKISVLYIYREKWEQLITLFSLYNKMNGSTSKINNKMNGSD
jgi:hypothetical protein